MMNLTLRCMALGVAGLLSITCGCSAANSDGGLAPHGSTSGGEGAGADGSGGTTGSGASSTGTGATLNFGGATAGGGSGSSAFPECDSVAYTGERMPMDMYIMFDQSVSMSCATGTGGDRWAAVRTALEEFVRSGDAAGMGVGIGYFGNISIQVGQVSCEAAAYEMPDAEIAPLPGNAQAIVDSLARHGPSSTTPTPPALAGALNHAIAWRNQTQRQTIVVLVTDGQPNDCGVAPGIPATPQQVAEVAAAGLTGANMQTYVVGITSGGIPCDWDPNPPNVTDLNLVAQSGGTNAAFIVDGALDVSAQFLDKMNQIRSSAQLPCEFTLPNDQAEVDIHKVNLSYTPPGGAAQPVLHAGDVTRCDPAAGGWFYDNPADPTRVILCPASCDVVKLQIGGLVDVVLGCPTEDIR